MRRLSLIAGTLITTALAGFIVACDDPVSKLPTTPSSPSVSSVVVTGPDSIAPGQTAQFTAMIRLSDGTLKAPAAGTAIQWFSNNTSLLLVNSAGVATAGQTRGDAFVTAAVGTGPSRRQSSKEVIIVPDGTYRVVGVVTEADYPTVPVMAALVRATPGTVSANTDFDGRYRLYGVPADATITITKAGYAPLSQDVHLTTHATQHFQLVLSGARLILTGPYTVTFDFAGTCSSNRPLAQALQRRSYDAVVTQNGPDITVDLTEPRFRTNTLGRGSRFTGRAGADGATFTLVYFDAYYYPYYGPSSYPNIAERLADSTILVAQGTVVASGPATNLSGLLNGGIYNWDARFPAGNTGILAYCNSPAIQFSMTPR